MLAINMIRVLGSDQKSDKYNKENKDFLAVLKADLLESIPKKMHG